MLHFVTDRENGLTSVRKYLFILTSILFSQFLIICIIIIIILTIPESIEDPQGCILDIDGLAKRVSQAILSREYLETRHNTVEDDGLIGLLNLMTNIVKHNPPFKTSKEGEEFLVQVLF